MSERQKFWKTVTRSQFPWEQEALDYIDERFPAQDNYRAWANFEFIADDGSINEVDLLVACPQGVFLVEIKSIPGDLSGDARDWTWDHEGRRRTDENPVILTNRKCKRLKALLSRQRAFKKEGSIRQARRDLGELCDLGLLERLGKGPATVYRQVGGGGHE